MITSITKLAKAVGRSQPTVSSWVKDERWTFGKGPWRESDVVRIKAWAAAELQANRGEGEVSVESPKSGMLTDAKVRKLIRECRLLDQRLNEMQGLSHSVAECEERQVRAINTTKRALTQELPHSAARKICAMPGADRLNVNDVSKLISDEVEYAIRTHLSPNE